MDKARTEAIPLSERLRIRPDIEIRKYHAILPPSPENRFIDVEVEIVDGQVERVRIFSSLAL